MRYQSKAVGSCWLLVPFLRHLGFILIFNQLDYFKSHVFNVRKRKLPKKSISDLDSGSMDFLRLK